MNRILRFVLSSAFAVILTSSLFAQGFEGQITVEVTSPKSPQPTTIITSTKGDRSVTEMDMPQGHLKLFIDKSTGKMTTVMESMKMGMEMDIKAMREMAEKMLKDKPDPKLEETGEKKLINNHPCVLYHLRTDTNEVTDMWMTDDIPNSIYQSLLGIYQNSAGAMRGGSEGKIAIEVEKLFAKGLVPIQVESFKNGVSERKMTFTKFEQKHLDDSVFEIPSDIKIQKMPAMGGMH